MSESYNVHRAAVEAAFPVPPADWTPIDFFPHIHQFGEVAAFRSEVTGRVSFSTPSLLALLRVRTPGRSQRSTQNGHREPVIGPYKSWKHTRDLFWPFWRKLVSGLQVDETVHRYGADVFDDPRTSESDLTRLRFERGDYRLELSPPFDRDDTTYMVTGDLSGPLDIGGIRTSPGATVIWTRHGTPFDTLTGVTVQSGTVLACSITSEDRTGTTVYVFTFQR